MTADNKLTFGFNETLATAPGIEELVFKINGKTVTPLATLTAPAHLALIAGTGSDAGKYVVNFDVLVHQGTVDGVTTTPSYIDVDNNGLYDSTVDIKITDGPAAGFKLSSSPAITSVTVSTVSTGFTTADASANTLRTGVTVSAK